MGESFAKPGPYLLWTKRLHAASSSLSCRLMSKKRPCFPHRSGKYISIVYHAWQLLAVRCLRVGLSEPTSHPAMLLSLPGRAEAAMT